MLLCSDGLCYYTTWKELYGSLMETDSREQLQQRLQAAVGFCCSCGETDSITALALKWNDRSPLPSGTDDWIEVWARLPGEAAPIEYDQKLGRIL